MKKVKEQILDQNNIISSTLNSDLIGYRCYINSPWKETNIFSGLGWVCFEHEVSDGAMNLCRIFFLTHQIGSTYLGHDLYDRAVKYICRLRNRILRVGENGGYTDELVQFWQTWMNSWGTRICIKRLHFLHHEFSYVFMIYLLSFLSFFNLLATTKTIYKPPYCSSFWLPLNFNLRKFPETCVIFSLLLSIWSPRFWVSEFLNHWSVSLLLGLATICIKGVTQRLWWYRSIFSILPTLNMFYRMCKYYWRSLSLHQDGWNARRCKVLVLVYESYDFIILRTVL